MGINGFQKWLYRYHPDCFTKNINKKCNYLCLDMNSIIHQKYNEFLKNKESYRENINEYIYSFIRKLINEYNPLNMTIICIDGVAPYLKLNQQKMRRYRHMIFNDNTSLYNPNEISPGTKFMNDLSDYLHKKKDKNIHISDDSCVGEGEQKIFHYLKQYANNDDVINIYGLDSDLILLSYILKFNITLILDRDNNIDYFNINNFKNNIGNIYSYDLVFLISLFGNDFIPDSPILSLYNDLHEVLKIYQIYYKSETQFICYNGKININNLSLFLNMLMCYEAKVINNKKNYVNFETLIEKCDDIKTLNKYMDTIIEDNKSKKICNDNIKFDDYMNLYYSKKLNITNKIKLHNISFVYLKTMQWVLLYYKNNTPPSWMWSFNYTFSPFLIDITDYVNNNIYKLNLSDFEKNAPLKQCEQLLYILPKDDILNLMDEKYHEYVSSNEELYGDYKIDLFNVYNKNKAIVILKNMDIMKIKNYCNK
jgi:5'-3' exonuclease